MKNGKVDFSTFSSLAYPLSFDIKHACLLGRSQGNQPGRDLIIFADSAVIRYLSPPIVVANGKLISNKLISN